jgi:hypothetical protein
MTVIPRISLVHLESSTRFAPLAVLGAYICQHDLLSPILTRLEFPQRMHTEEPGRALIDLWVSILAGCRSVSQVNTKIRPEIALAKVWGRKQFCEQSTLARVLDACEAEQVSQMRAGVEAIYRWIGQAPQRGWNIVPLTIDIDLTGLPAGRDAEGSTKGYFSGKKGHAAANCAVLEPPTTMKVSVPCSTQAIN